MSLGIKHHIGRFRCLNFRPFFVVLIDGCLSQASLKLLACLWELEAQTLLQELPGCFAVFAVVFVCRGSSGAAYSPPSSASRVLGSRPWNCHAGWVIFKGRISGCWGSGLCGPFPNFLEYISPSSTLILCFPAFDGGKP